MDGLLPFPECEDDLPSSGLRRLMFFGSVGFNDRSLVLENALTHFVHEVTVCIEPL